MKRPNISVLLLDVTFGIVFALFNFDGFLRYAAHHWLSSSWLAETIVRISWWPQRFLASLNASHLSLFHDLLVLCFYGVWVCLGFIALLSLIRLNLRITFSGLLGLTTGAASIGILAWLGVLLVVLGGVLMAVLRFLLRIWNFLVGILGAVWTFIVRILTAIWGFLLPIINFLLPILLIVAVIALVVWGDDCPGAPFRLWRCRDCVAGCDCRVFPARYLTRAWAMVMVCTPLRAGYFW
ncbi:hypothetical protein [Candidatus Amarolinea dominans]|uniref:hypothetical protein n=1 Tax=Candidatus Amarolinea dominans TaxID=3140696 RepID=UPI001DFC4527|nr:hypothetical protein [Anaerolineae bacterium]